MNEETKRQILDKIKAYDRVIVSRHIRPDGDAVGSTMGFARILKDSFPEKEVLVACEDYTDYVSFLGKEDGAVPAEKYADALLVVLDTAVLDRISNENAKLAKEIIKIDHHVDIAPYGDISWVEDFRSSVCEMVVDFYVTFKDELKLSKEAALCLFTGMVTDSGRFRYVETSGDTLRLAAVLLDVGIDTETLYARLYLEEFDEIRFRSYVYDNMKTTENGVAYIYVDEAMQQRFSLTREQASNTVGLLGEIKGSIIWIAFIDYEGTIRVRLRSRFVEVNKLAEKYHGGGHVCACGATVYSHEEMEALLRDADDLIKEFKANNFYL